MTSLSRSVTRRDVPEWTLGERLRKIRRQIGAGQAEFAAQLGENPKTYAAWELDTSRPRNPDAVARRIEMLTGYPASWVLGTDGRVGDGEAAPSPAVAELLGVSTAEYTEWEAGLSRPPARLIQIAQAIELLTGSGVTTPGPPGPNAEKRCFYSKPGQDVAPLIGGSLVAHRAGRAAERRKVA